MLFRFLNICHLFSLCIKFIHCTVSLCAISYILRFTMFFLAIYVFLRREKLGQKLTPWRKMTNIRYLEKWVHSDMCETSRKKFYGSPNETPLSTTHSTSLTTTTKYPRCNICISDVVFTWVLLEMLLLMHLKIKECLTHACGMMMMGEACAVRDLV